MSQMTWTTILTLMIICLLSKVVGHKSTTATNLGGSSGKIKTSVVPSSQDVMSQSTRNPSLTNRELSATDTTTLGHRQTVRKASLTHSDFVTTAKYSLDNITPRVERTASTIASDGLSASGSAIPSMSESTIQPTNSFITTRSSGITSGVGEEATTKASSVAFEVDASTPKSLLDGTSELSTPLLSAVNTEFQTPSTSTSRPQYATETAHNTMSTSRTTDLFLLEHTPNTLTSTRTFTTTNNITSNEHIQEDNTKSTKPFDDTKTTSPTVEQAAELITNSTNTEVIDGTTIFSLDDITETAAIRGYTQSTVSSFDDAPKSKLLSSSAPTTVNSTKDTITPLADTLSELIIEHVILCGLKSLCTVVNPSTDVKHIACCSECSCDAGCLSHWNCCVDYAFVLARNNTPFSALDELQEAMANITTRLALETVLNDMYIQHPDASKFDNNGHDEDDEKEEKLEEEKEGEEEKVVETFYSKGVAGNDFTTLPTSRRIPLTTATNVPSREDSTHILDYTIECLPREMFRSQRKSKPREHYSIITDCKRPGVESDTECVRNNITQAGFFDDIPVTSLVSGKTYRNRSVMECCDGDSGPFEYWKMFVECYVTLDFTFIPLYVLHPLKLLDEENLYNECSVVFEPNAATHAHGLAPNKCQNVDIHACEDTGSSKRGLFLNSFCERVSLSVELETFAKRTVYNNVACMLCNNVSHETHTSCNDVTGSRDTIRLRVNLDDLSRHQTPLEELSDGGLLNVQDLTTLDGLTYECSGGFIFVPKLGVCKRLFCPRSMYIVNGSCVPLFSHVTGASFKTVFNMTVLSISAKSVNKTQFEEDFVMFLSSGLFANYSLTTDHIRIRSLGMTYMVEMVLTPNKDTEGTIDDVVRTITRLYYTTVDIRVSRHAVVRLGISPGSAFYFRQNRPFRTGSVGTGSNAKDVKTPRDDGLVLNREIRISESFTCYRIGIYVHDFIVLNKMAVRIPAINETIYTENMDFRPSSFELLTCVDLFIDGYRYFYTDGVSHVNVDVKKRFDDIGGFNNTREPVDYRGEIDYSVLIVIIGVAVTISVVVARLAVKRFWVRVLHWRSNA